MKLKIKKNNKFLYYIKSYITYFLPNSEAEDEIQRLSKELKEGELKEIYSRVDYYNHLKLGFATENNTCVKNLREPQNPKSYYFDTYEYAKYFDANNTIDFVFGDVDYVPQSPSIVKSRPIGEGNENSVLLNLDKIRHFVFVQNDKKFEDKKQKLIGRCAVYQTHRHLFFEKHFDNPNCDLGQVNLIGGDEKWIKPKMSLEKHLDYQFILSLEGNDVATNLKWIMSSNSIAVMPKLKFETWFMEGELRGGTHYIEIKEDYSDLDEQLEYYRNRPELCAKIIENAHKHVALFQSQKTEKLCSLLVLKKYFESQHEI